MLEVSSTAKANLRSKRDQHTYSVLTLINRLVLSAPLAQDQQLVWEELQVAYLACLLASFVLAALQRSRYRAGRVSVQA